LGLVSAAPSSSGREVLHQEEPPFSRSYGGNLPSSLTRVLSIALVFSTCPPASVWGTGTSDRSLEDFLGSMGSLASPEAARRRVSELAPSRICLGRPPTHLPQDDHRLGRATLLRPPFASLVPSGSVVPPRWRNSLSSPDLGWARSRWYWNINQSSIAYASRPRLRARLTLGG
jgi:hypothetical protein